MLGNESSRGRQFQGTKGPPMELSFPGTKVLGYESSMNRRTSDNMNFRCVYTSLGPAAHVDVDVLKKCDKTKTKQKI